MPNTATRLDGTNHSVVPVSQLQKDDRLLVRAGEPIPADGLLAAGSTSVDEALLTGEPRPQAKAVGDELSAGSVNLDGMIEMTVTQTGSDTTLGTISRLSERARYARPAYVQLADRVASYIVVAILVVAGAILVQLALGALYAWSVFTARLTDQAGAYAFAASETAWVFSTGLATFAIVMVMAGRILPKSGPRPLAIAGGLLLGAGFVAGGLFGETFWVQLLSIGVVSGADIGLASVMPIAVCVQ